MMVMALRSNDIIARIDERGIIWKHNHKKIENIKMLKSLDNTFLYDENKSENRCSTVLSID